METDEVTSDDRSWGDRSEPEEDVEEEPVVPVWARAFQRIINRRPGG